MSGGQQVGKRGQEWRLTKEIVGLGEEHGFYMPVFTKAGACSNLCFKRSFWLLHEERLGGNKSGVRVQLVDICGGQGKDAGGLGHGGSTAAGGKGVHSVSLAGMADNLDMEMEKRILEYSQGFGPSSRVDFILVRTLGWPIICIS